MALPSIISNSALWPDFKNTAIGPFSAIKMEGYTVISASNTALGSNVNNEKKGQSFLNTTEGLLDCVELAVAKTGSPTDSLIIDICANDVNKPGTVLATSNAVAGVNFITGAFNSFFRFSFFSPVVLAANTTYWVVLRRTGAFNASNYYIWSHYGTGDVYTGGSFQSYAAGNWTTGGTADTVFKVKIATDILYQPLVDKTNSKIRMFKSADDGHTWAEQDSANAPVILNTSNLKSISALEIDTKIAIARLSAANTLALTPFNTVTDLWEANISTNANLSAVNTNVSGVAPFLAGFRLADLASGSSSDYVLAWNGATQSVSGNARRRIKLCRRAASVWNSTPYDVVGSANTPDTTLPGGALHHDLRAVLVDGLGDFHVFYTRTDTNQIQHRVFKNNNTFTTINVLGSTPAVASNTSPYAIGIPTNYFKDGEWYIAIPYIDSTTSTLKVARCKASISDVASNWTIQEASTHTPESSLSNPSILAADGIQGSRLWLFFTETDRKLYFTNDNGTGVWDDTLEWNSMATKTVAAISAQAAAERVSIVYQNDSPTPDEINYDEVQIAVVKDAVAGGTYTREFDLGDGFSGDYIVSLVTANQSGITCNIDVSTKEDAGSSYQDRGTISNESEGTANITFTAGRFVQLVINVIGGAGTLSVNGFES
jgi:hypothetical protein